MGGISLLSSASITYSALLSSMSNVLICCLVRLGKRSCILTISATSSEGDSSCVLPSASTPESTTNKSCDGEVASLVPPTIPSESTWPALMFWTNKALIVSASLVRLNVQIPGGECTSRMMMSRSAVHVCHSTLLTSESNAESFRARSSSPTISQHPPPAQGSPMSGFPAGTILPHSAQIVSTAEVLAGSLLCRWFVLPFFLVSRSFCPFTNMNSCEPPLILLVSRIDLCMRYATTRLGSIWQDSCTLCSPTPPPLMAKLLFVSR
mmetsp:Transcript_13544/g.21159  ORF Transcript_13544/g.21159 Transcript_13544/m.21159 type:complete len:265 (+) Transcript_13544:561-1355(+)